VLLFDGLASLEATGTLVVGLVTGPWPSVADILLAAGSGLAAGLLLGWLRRLGIDHRVVTELVATTLSPETLDAAKLGRTVLFFHMAMGTVIGLGIGMLGVAAPLLGDTETITALQMAAIGSGPGGGGPPFAVVVALMVVIAVLALIAAVLLTSAAAAIAKGVVTGAIAGASKEWGMAAALALTRLWTTRLTADAAAAPPRSTPFRAAVEQMTDSDLTRNYLHWLDRQGIAVTVTAIVEHRTSYEADLNRQRSPLRYKGWLRDLSSWVWAVESMAKRREPQNRMHDTEEAPVFDGSQETLFHRRWFRSTLLTGAVEGALAGGVYAALASVLHLSAA
jgi:hypothetical protein